MRILASTVLLAASMSCAPTVYHWQTVAGKNPPVILRIDVDPKVPQRESIKQIYPHIIQNYLAAWLPVEVETASTSSDAIYLQVFISCRCEGNFIRQANATMDLVAAFDKDSREHPTRNTEREEAERLGYQPEDLLGSLSIYSPQTVNNPYKSHFLTTFITRYMDPLSNDAKLVQSNIQQEQARGLARWIVADLQGVGLAPKAPVH